MAAGEGVGVVLGGQPHHPHVHSLGQDHVDSAQRCVDTRRIAVVDHRDVLREALQQADLLGGERRAGRGHYVLHTGLVHGDHVRVTLHHDGYVLLLDGPLGEEEAIELVFLAVDDALGRVEVLAHVLVRAQNAAAEGDHSSRDVVHGEDHTVAEAVEERAVAVAADRESRIDQILLPIARLACGPREGRPLRRAVAEPEFADRGFGEAALLAEVGEPHAAPLLGIVEVVGEVVGRPAVKGEHAFPVVVAAHLLLAELPLLDLDSVAFGHDLQRLGKGHALVLHHEVDGVAALAATEALVDSFRGRDDERGGLLVVERAARHVVDTLFLECHVVADDFDDVRRGENPVYCFAIDHGVQRYE